MAEMIVEGLNGTIKVNGDAVQIKRKPGISLTDYVNNGVVEFSLKEIKRLDYKKPGFLGNGYFRFVFKDEDIPEVAVPARKLTTDRHSLILKTFNPTNIPDADKMYNYIQEKLLKKKAPQESGTTKK